MELSHVIVALVLGPIVWSAEAVGAEPEVRERVVQGDGSRVEVGVEVRELRLPGRPEVSHVKPPVTALRKPDQNAATIRMATDHTSPTRLDRVIFFWWWSATTICGHTLVPGRIGFFPGGIPGFFRGQI